ncbi:choline phosphate cytidylyltransferase [Savitreella phatthalungensis]
MSREYSRVYIDGCLDMFHHGHSGAILQARRVGEWLVCGVHSDEEIAANKGIPVMSMDERCTSARACKWVSEVSEGAPYVINCAYLDLVNAQVAIHGDDITTDANGNDCYQEVKDAKRFVVCKRTPQISTTDLVGRMLLHTRDHHFPPSSAIPYSSDSVALYKQYAAGDDGVSEYAGVSKYKEPGCEELVRGKVPEAGQEVVYADGGWDLFTAGHAEMLRLAKHHDAHDKDGRGRFVVVGLHADHTVNKNKGFNYPIMNIRERALTILACRYVDALVLDVPYETTKKLLSQLPHTPTAVYHGPVPLPEGAAHGYEDVADLLRILPQHDFANLNAATIVDRIVARSAEYLERQRKKGVKADREQILRAAELGQQRKQQHEQQLEQQ